MGYDKLATALKQVENYRKKEEKRRKVIVEKIARKINVVEMFYADVKRIKDMFLLCPKKNG